MNDDRDLMFVKKMTSIRRLIETVIGQLMERNKIPEMKARDLWHLTHRVIQKVTSHTVALFINKSVNPEGPLGFEKLVF